MLTLYEALYVLSLHEEKGTPLPGAAESLPVALVGAILGDLAILEKIKINDHHRLELLDKEPTQDEFLDEALEAIQESEQLRKMNYWIHALSTKPKKSSRRILEQLEGKGILQQEDGRALWVIPSPLSPGQQASAKYALKARLRAIALACDAADMSEMALLCLLRACNLLEIVFTKDERKLASQRIRELVLGEALRSPVAQTIEEIEEAVALHAPSD